MPWTPADLPDLRDHRVLVTGANAGLGLHTTRGLARAGAEVLLACRNPAKAEQARGDLARELPGARLRVVPLDLADLDSVARLGDQLLEDGAPLDVLVNNAGLMAVDASTTAQGFEMQYGVNHLGHFALTARLLPQLERSGRGRVVSVSSMGHRAARGTVSPTLDGSYDRWQSYFHSKLDNLHFTAELDRRLRGAGSTVTALAAHPGGSHTDLGFEGSGLSNRVIRRLVPLVTQSAEAGARPILRAATDRSLPPGAFVGPRFVVRGATPVVETPSRRARDAAAARRLWARSVEQSGVGPAPALR